MYRLGRRASTPLLTAYVRPGTGAVRLGIVVHRRVGGAVTRNRVRRRVREAFLRVRPRLVGGGDVVLAPRPEALEAPFEELVRAVARALAAGGIPSREASDRGPRPGGGEGGL